MYMKHDLQTLGANIVYVKPVATADLPQEVQDEAGDLTTLFAMHNTRGEQVALVATADIASQLAAINNMEMVTLQ